MKNFIHQGFVLTLFVSFFTSSAFGQVQADGKFHIPESVKDICLNYEQNLVVGTKGLLQANGDLVKSKISDRTALLEMGESWEKFILKNSNLWSLLDCTQILYKK